MALLAGLLSGRDYLAIGMLRTTAPAIALFLGPDGRKEGPGL
jgi:hypothetical protein